MPMIQKPAPEFTATAVIDGEFKDVSLADYKGKWVYLFFYPLDFTFVCPTEIIAFSEAEARFRELNTQILGVSVDSHFTHLRWIETPRNDGGLGGLNYPLVSDLSREIATKYDVLLGGGVALRGSFIIDPNGNLRQATINDLPVGRNVDEAIRLIKAFQYTEEHGEVCPAGWEEGADTIKPNVEGSKEYFSKQG